MESTIEKPIMEMFEIISTSPFWFNGTNFKRWKRKMLFYLNLFKVVYVISENPPKKINIESMNIEKFMEHQTRKLISMRKMSSIASTTFLFRWLFLWLLW